MNLADLGCDFYASSPHKWLLAPKGSGLLYVSEAWVDRLWPTIVSGGWIRCRTRRCDSTARAPSTIRYTPGSRRPWTSTTWWVPSGWSGGSAGLPTGLYDGLGRIQGVELKSATDAALRAPMISFTVKGWTTDDLIKALWDRGTVRVRHVAEYDYQLGPALDPHL